jgi:hypothetical protein
VAAHTNQAFDTQVPQTMSESAIPQIFRIKACKPKAPIIPSPQLQPRNDRIQVDELSVTAGGVAQDDLLVQERAGADQGNIRRGLIAPEILEPICRQFSVISDRLSEQNPLFCPQSEASTASL